MTTNIVSRVVQCGTMIWIPRVGRLLQPTVGGPLRRSEERSRGPVSSTVSSHRACRSRQFHANGWRPLRVGVERLDHALGTSVVLVSWKDGDSDASVTMKYPEPRQTHGGPCPSFRTKASDAYARTVRAIVHAVQSRRVVSPLCPTAGARPGRRAWAGTGSARAHRLLGRVRKSATRCAVRRGDSCRADAFGGMQCGEL